MSPISRWQRELAEAHCGVFTPAHEYCMAHFLWPASGTDDGSLPNKYERVNMQTNWCDMVGRHRTRKAELSTIYLRERIHEKFVLLPRTKRQVTPTVQDEGSVGATATPNVPRRTDAKALKNKPTLQVNYSTTTSLIIGSVSTEHHSILNAWDQHSRLYCI